MKVAFLGTPSFIQPIKDNLAKHFTLVDSLYKTDLAVVASYGQILTTQQLNSPKYGCINVHPSFLPKLRGSSPIQTAILNGEKKSGITIIKMDQKVDHGPIIYQEEMELSSSDTFDTLSKKMFLKASQVLPRIITDFISGKITPIPQNHSQATYTSHLSREEGYFDINNPPDPEKLDRMIRAYYPWPGVWTKWDKKIVKFLPGGLLQMEGKKPVLFIDFLNGYPNFPLISLPPLGI